MGLLLFLWGGGPFLFAVTGGAIGGTRPKTTTPSLTAATEGTTKTVKAQTRSGATATPAPQTPKPQQERPAGQASSNDDSDNDTSQNQNESRVVYLNYMVDPPLTSTATTTITATVTPAAPASQSQPQTQSQPTATAVATIPAIPTPGPGAEDAGNGDGSNNNSNYNRVGQPPTNLGGLNGPHGSFLAPSRLVAPAQGLDVPVQKAIVNENLVIISPTTQTLQAGSGVSATTTSTPYTSTPYTSRPVTPTVAIKTSIVWPRPGEVLHYGAYPGEVGNCLILGTQSNLAALRHMEQNDEIRLYDRKNNLFVYRVVAFSPIGQPEREINPASSQDSWIFDTLTPGQALLTIIVNEPLPLPPVDPNATAQAGIGNTPPASAGRDDWANPKKLAYRAVLVGFAPNTGKSSSATSANPATTPVAVPSQVWQVQPAPLPRHMVLDEDNTTATATSATPTTPAGSNSGDTPIDLLAVLRQLAVQINKTGSYQGISIVTTTQAAQTPQSQNGKEVITATPKS